MAATSDKTESILFHYYWQVFFGALIRSNSTSVSAAATLNPAINPVWPLFWRYVAPSWSPPGSRYIRSSALAICVILVCRWLCFNYCLEVGSSKHCWDKYKRRHFFVSYYFEEKKSNIHIVHEKGYFLLFYKQNYYLVTLKQFAFKMYQQLVIVLRVAKLHFQHNCPHPHRLLQSSVSVLLLHRAPAVRAHPQRQLQGAGCLARLRCAILARHQAVRERGAVFALTSTQEAAIAGRIGSPLVQAKREGRLSESRGKGSARYKV